MFLRTHPAVWQWGWTILHPRPLQRSTWGRPVLAFMGVCWLSFCPGFHFYITGDVEHLSISLFTFHMFSSVKDLFKSFVHILLGCFLYCWILKFFMTSKYKYHFSWATSKYFLPACGFSFYSCNGAFLSSEVFNCDESNIRFFLLCVMFLTSYQKYPCLIIVKFFSFIFF